MIGMLELTGSKQTSSLKSAGTQVQKAISEAYSIAQNESTPVTVNFYGSANPTAQIRNTYQVLRGTTSMQPPLGIKYLTRNESGADHYYVQLNDGGSQPTIQLDRIIRFAPVGATTKMVDVSGVPVTSDASVILQYAGVSTSITVTVNGDGRVTTS